MPLRVDPNAEPVLESRSSSSTSCLTWNGMQMVAFYDTTKTPVAELPGYLGFATIPGDVCAAQSAAPAAAGSTPQ